MYVSATIISNETLAPTAEPHAEVTVAGKDYEYVNFTWEAITANSLPTVYVLAFSFPSTYNNASKLLNLADIVSYRLRAYCFV